MKQLCISWLKQDTFNIISTYPDIYLKLWGKLDLTPSDL